MAAEPPARDWLADFHAGKRHTLEEFYRDYYGTVDRAVGRLIGGPDRETVVHEVFFRVLSNPELRQAFRGGSVAAWIATVARNHSIDFRRRHGRREILEQEYGSEAGPNQAAEAEHDGPEASVEAALLTERFCRDVLPERWRPVFDACFLKGMTQREAASALGLSRTTLLYQQHRVRALLRRFLLEVES